MAEHRVPMLGSGLRRYEDPANSSDPRIRELVTALATLEPAPAPRAHFRAELRAQLVAVAPRLVAEGPAVELRPAAARAAEQVEAAPGRRRFAMPQINAGALRRPLGIVVGAFAVFALMLGGAVFVSKKALPGDALYALKRANENVQLSMTHGTDRGRTYLEFASNRAAEVKELLSHSSALASGSGPVAAGGIDGHTADLIRSTLGAADDDLRNGTSVLTNQAVRDGSADPLDIVTGWAPSQLADLRAISERLPAGSLKARAAKSAALVAAAMTRAEGLQATLDCDTLDNARTDALGPIPPTVCNLPAAPGPATTKPGSTSASTQAPKPGSTTVPKGSTTIVIPGQPGGVVSGPTTAPASDSPSSPQPGLPLPSLGGSSTAVGPISADSCGVSVSLGPLGIGLGNCTTTAGN